MEINRYVIAAVALAVAAGILVQDVTARLGGVRKRPGRRSHLNFNTERIVSLVTSAMPMSAESERAARDAIERSGQTMTPGQLWASRIILAVAGALFGGYFMTRVSSPLAFLLVPVGGAMGAMMPQVILISGARRWRDDIERDLPNALDLMAIAVAAGTSFDAAIRIVATRTTGPLAEAFEDVVDASQFSSTSDALLRLANKAQVQPLTVFVASLIQAQSTGIPLASILKSQAESVRTYRRQRIEEQINRLPTKMIFPQLIIFAALLLAILVPALYNLINQFGAM